MRAGLTALAGVVLPLLAATSLAGQGREWQFGLQSATPVVVPRWLARDSLREALSYRAESREPVAGFLADLNRDGTLDYIFRVSVDVCGTNCEFMLVDGASHAALGRVGGSAIVVREQMVNGYPVIHSYSHSSADAGRWSVSVFDGDRYVAVGGIYLEGESLRRHFEALGGIRSWPPPRQPIRQKPSLTAHTGVLLARSRRGAG